MTSKEAEEIKEELRRIEKKRQDQIDTVKAWAIAAVVIALLIFFYVRGSNANPDMQDTAPTCDETGLC